jgi:hypothetical protein
MKLQLVTKWYPPPEHDEPPPTLRSPVWPGSTLSRDARKVARWVEQLDQKRGYA